jgi:hypothetical protein
MGRSAWRLVCIQTSARLSGVASRIKVLAFLMCQMPTGIRKLQWWWDNLYWSINKGVSDDGLVLDDGVGLGSQWPAEIHGPGDTEFSS